MESLNKELLFAAMKGDNTSVAKCLANGAEINYKDALGMTPLHKAARIGHTNTVEMLISKGADINSRTTGGGTALHWAAEEGHTDTVAMFISKGAVIDSKNFDGYTPLHQATMNGRIETVAMLISKGAEIGNKDNDGKTPYDYADEQIRDLMKRHRDDSVHQSDQDVLLPGINDTKTFKSLLTKGTYKAHGNRIYLAGACRVGKSTLSSLLTGDEIPLEWNSTDGLRIFFGRNGIDLAQRKMVPLMKGEGKTNILSNVLLGKPNVNKRQSETGVSMFKSARTITLPTEDMSGSKRFKSSKYKPHKFQGAQSMSRVHEKQEFFTEMSDIQEDETPFKKWSKLGLTTIHDDIKQELRKGDYKVMIAPSDLVDFGGQRSYDMTHQLFIQGKGTFTLIFDGRKRMHDLLAEYPQGDVTSLSILNWTDSILTYCEDEDDDIVPVILFVATHRDQLTEDEQSERMTEFKRDLKDLFQNHESKSRIKYDDIFFINGTDINDLEVERLKKMYVDIAFKQKLWGRRMPMAWVPLELQMSQMRAQKISLISKNILMQINEDNDDLQLTDHQLDEFLRVQHMLGKIMYFEEHLSQMRCFGLQTKI